MPTDGTREFEIDKNKKKNCKLLVVDDKIKIKIKKQQNNENEEYFFRMIETDAKVAGAFIACEAGHVPSLRVDGKAQECGIGKMLMLLCLNEEKIHNVVIENDNNKAMSVIESYSRTKVPKAKEMEKWAKSKCEKIFSLIMTAEPPTAAHVYFNSALDLGFTEMFIAIRKTPFGKPRFYPNEGPCTVKALKKRYTDDGYMEDNEGSEVRMGGDDKVRVWGQTWYFCKPKEATLPMAKCTNL